MRLSLLVIVFSALFLPLPKVLADDYCGTDDHIPLYDPASTNTQFGNANILKTNLKQPWPLSKKYKTRTIRFCFVDEAARAVLWCDLMRGMLTWDLALGPRNAENGHCVAWWEARALRATPAQNTPRYCFKPGTTEWNPDVLPDTLAVHYEPGGTPSATVGYTPMEWDSTPGRHKIVLPAKVAKERVAHELGHVLGMLHEQTRNDRDAYVSYRCENVAGYSTALTSAILAGEPDTAKRLCEDRPFAQKYGFDGAQFTKNYDYARIPGIVDDTDISFDMGSIMLYPSYAYKNGDCSQDRLEKCPLVGLDRVNGIVVGKSWIHENAAPSQGDRAFVKKWYLFVEGRPARKGR